VGVPFGNLGRVIIVFLAHPARQVKVVRVCALRIKVEIGAPRSHPATRMRPAGGRPRMCPTLTPDGPAAEIAGERARAKRRGRDGERERAQAQSWDRVPLFSGPRRLAQKCLAIGLAVIRAVEPEGVEVGRQYREELRAVLRTHQEPSPPPPPSHPTDDGEGTRKGRGRDEAGTPWQPRRRRTRGESKPRRSATARLALPGPPRPFGSDCSFPWRSPVPRHPSP
jgi:hypothetical protein